MEVFWGFGGVGMGQNGQNNGKKQGDWEGFYIMSGEYTEKTISFPILLREMAGFQGPPG